MPFNGYPEWNSPEEETFMDEDDDIDDHELDMTRNILNFLEVFWTVNQIKSKSTKVIDTKIFKIFCMDIIYNLI